MSGTVARTDRHCPGCGRAVPAGEPRCPGCRTAFEGPDVSVLTLVVRDEAGEEKPAAAVDAGSLRGRYRIEGPLGRGAMGTVVLARRLSDGEAVAIKFLLPEQDRLLKRFLREAEIMMTIRHPHVVRVDEIHVIGGSPCMVCEYMAGGSLTTRMRRQGRMPAAEAARLAVQMLEGLEACHREKIVHRDVKPDNILFDGYGNIKVADFGLARDHGAQASTLTGVGTLIGTPRYMSPEQAQGEPAVPASDLYAAGVILYQMLAGQHLFDAASPIALLRLHVTATPPPLPPGGEPVPPRMLAVMERALAKTAGERPPSARAMADELLAAGGRTGRHAASSGARVSRSLRVTAAPAAAEGSRVRTALGAVLALVIISAGLFASRPAHRGERSPPSANPDAPASSAANAAPSSDRLIGMLERFDARPMIAELVSSREYDRNLDFPQILSVFGHDTTGVRHVRRRTPDGHFTAAILRRLVQQPFWKELESFRPRIRAYFESAEPWDRKLRMHAAIQRLEWVTLVALAQRETRTPDLVRITAGLVELSHRLPGRPEPVMTTVLPGEIALHEHPLTFTARTFRDWGGLSNWLDTDTYWRKACRLPDALDEKALAAHFPPERTVPLVIPRGRPGARLRVRAVVARLAPATCLSVRLHRGRELAPLELRMVHPGTAEWFSTMDEISPTRRRERAPAGHYPWYGEITAELPAAALSAGETHATISIEPPPGSTITQLSALPRATIVRDLCVSIVER